MIDVAYIVRPGHTNEELRYSLRSLANVPHGDVWIFGHRPAWVNEVVRHVFVPQRDPLLHKYENATQNLLALAVDGPERFALFNDDFFCLRPAADMPGPAHRGLLIDLAAERLGNYGRMLRATASLLRESGKPYAYAYTLHKPMVMSREGLQLTLDHGLSRRAEHEQISWRSLYGNMLRLAGPREDDVKVHGDGPVPAGPWLSTNDGSFKYHRAGRLIRAAFPNPSPYEYAPTS